MGNCLPFFHFASGNSDDLTHLNNLTENREDSQRPTSGSSRSSSTSSSTTRHTSHSSRGEGSEGPPDDRSSHQRYHRNLHPSAYVNQLYINSTMTSEDNAESQILDEKRKARVRGLLEQIPIDSYVIGGKGDDECAICMVDFVENEPIRYLPCRHSYHLNCIDDWLLRSFTCPSCMEPVDSAILSSFTVNSTNANLSTLLCSPATIGLSSGAGPSKS